MSCDLNPVLSTAVEDGPNLPDGVPPLASLYLYLTSGCNLRCRHCWISPGYVKGEPAAGEYLDLELLRRAVAEARPLGLGEAKLTGGEPVLHPQFLAIVDMLTAEGLSLTLETNGTLIDADLARHLKDRTSVGFVSVSLDGPDAETHDAFRGIAGSFAAAVQGFKHLVAAGFRPQIIMAPYRGNVHLVGDVVELAVRLGAGSVKFNPITRMGRGIGMQARGELLDFDEVLALARLVRGPLQSRAPISLHLVTPLAFYSVGELLRGQGEGTCHVRNVLGILGSGEMALCGIGQTIPELCFGHLRDASLTGVWLNHPVLQALRRTLDGPLPGICGRCIHARRCSAHCVAQNYLDSGQLVSPDRLCVEAERLGAFPAGRLREGP